MIDGILLQQFSPVSLTVLTEVGLQPEGTAIIKGLMGRIIKAIEVCCVAVLSASDVADCKGKRLCYVLCACSVIHS